MRTTRQVKYVSLLVTLISILFSDAAQIIWNITFFDLPWISKATIFCFAAGPLFIWIKHILVQIGSMPDHFEQRSLRSLARCLLLVLGNTSLYVFLRMFVGDGHEPLQLLSINLFYYAQFALPFILPLLYTKVGLESSLTKLFLKLLIIGLAFIALFFGPYFMVLFLLSSLFTEDPPTTVVVLLASLPFLAALSFVRFPPNQFGLQVLSLFGCTLNCAAIWKATALFRENAFYP